jgi:hypothetical protein
MDEIIAQNHKGAGRPSELTDELCLNIRDWVIEGRTIEEIAELSQIPYKTIDHWIYRNYQGFADRLLSWRHERFLRLSDHNVEDILTMETENVGCTMKGDKFTFNDPKLWSVKSDMTKFVKETLGKKHYSKRSEVTGADGKDLMPTPLLTGVKPITSEENGIHSDHSSPQDSGLDQENQRDSGGNIGREDSISPASSDSQGTGGQEANDDLGGVGIVPTP